MFQDRNGFLGAGSAFSDLYSGVSATGRCQDGVQDSNRSREDVDVKRSTTQGKHLCDLVESCNITLHGCPKTAAVTLYGYLPFVSHNHNANQQQKFQLAQYIN